VSARHWFLAVGTLVAFVTLVTTGSLGWTEALLMFSGGLVGIWASEGVHAHARERGIDLEPL
jgi:hypothetical protein